MGRWFVRAIIALVVLFLAIQLIPYGRSHTNPPVQAEPAWGSPAARALAKSACFDCHSNETVWPWYSWVAPVSWLVQRDVNAGRSELNFSEWPPEAGKEEGGGGELVEAVLEGEMPPWFYPLMHPDAKLTAARRQTLADGLRSVVPAGEGAASADE